MHAMSVAENEAIDPLRHSLCNATTPEQLSSAASFREPYFTRAITLPVRAEVLYPHISVPSVESLGRGVQTAAIQPPPTLVQCVELPSRIVLRRVG